MLYIAVSAASSDYQRCYSGGPRALWTWVCVANVGRKLRILSGGCHLVGNRYLSAVRRPRAPHSGQVQPDCRAEARDYGGNCCTCNARSHLVSPLSPPSPFLFPKHHPWHRDAIINSRSVSAFTHSPTFSS